MTNLQYRGFSYAQTTTTEAKRAPMPLMYRGVAHDGTAQEPIHDHGVNMVYRGIAFVRAAAGQIVALEHATPSPIGQAAFAK